MMGGVEQRPSFTIDDGRRLGLLLIFLLVGISVCSSAFRHGKTGERLEGPGIGEPGKPLGVPGFRVNVNSAQVAELRLLPSVGEQLAGRIVAYRESRGIIESLPELLSVPGIGPTRLAEIEPFLILVADDAKFGVSLDPAGQTDGSTQVDRDALR
jgi:competence ComEA-like helix-hairpin-helix protein